ncbi:hypothetical protein K438DRAFT_1746729 [Mycena galopus ATCC 62051]|nr:hypothetical protein K438DRAFT_1746729 [Mycena galopus ATCC 62051]
MFRMPQKAVDDELQCLNVVNSGGESLAALNQLDLSVILGHGSNPRPKTLGGGAPTVIPTTCRDRDSGLIQKGIGNRKRKQNLRVQVSLRLHAPVNAVIAQGRQDYTTHYMAELPASITPTEFQSERNLITNAALISLTILYYDYGLTLNEEIAVYWGTPFATWGSALFYLNRYVSMVGNTVPILMGSFWSTRMDPQRKVQVCAAMRTYHQYFSIVAQIFVAALLIMRTYALYQRSCRILILTTGITLAAVVFGAYIIFSGRGSSDTLDDVFLNVGCASGLESSQGRRFGFGWMGMLLFDITVFGLTAWKALAHSREQRGQRGGPSLFTILMRDVNGRWSSGANYAGPYTRGVATTFTNVISSVMISRLMLNLRTHAIDESRGRMPRTAESTTLFDNLPVISTVVDYVKGNQDLSKFVAERTHEDEGFLHRAKLNAAQRGGPHSQAAASAWQSYKGRQTGAFFACMETKAEGVGICVHGKRRQGSKFASADIDRDSRTFVRRTIYSIEV